MFTNILFLIPIFLWMIYRGMRARSIISLWAEKNNKALISAEFRLLSRGPFIFPGASVAMVYKCEFKDTKGEKEKGWVKIGNDWIGLLGSTEIRYIRDEN